MIIVNQLKQIRKKALSFPFLFSLLFIQTCIVLTGHAQVATPALDTAIPATLASATAWRESSTFGLEVVNGGGTTPTQEVNGNSVSYLATSNPIGIFYIEAFRTVGNQKVKNLSDSTETTVDTEAIQANFGFRFDTFNAGFTYNTAEVDEDDGGSLIERSEIITTGFSFSSLLDPLYFAVGIEQQVDTPSDGEENTWENQIYGIALIIGDTSTSQFRIEYSNILSPAATAEAGSKKENVHYGYSETRAGLEVRFANFPILFSIQNERFVEERENSLNVVQTLDTVGLLYFSSFGFDFGAYRSTGKERFVFQSGDGSFEQSSDTETEYTRLSLAFNY